MKIGKHENVEMEDVTMAAFVHFIENNSLNIWWLRKKVA
jgi:hypothetical protein